MNTWVDTVRSLFLGPWWWLPSVFFGPWQVSVLLIFLIVVNLWVLGWTAGSNASLLCALALAGDGVGLWIRRLRGWECAVLVPDLPRHLFVVSLAIVLFAALTFSVLSMYAGNPIPALGPALLVGVGVVVLLESGVVRPGGLDLVVPGLPVLLLAGAVTGTMPYWQVLSHPAVQASAVVFAVTLLAILKHRLQRPVSESFSSVTRDQKLVVGLWNKPAIVKWLLQIALSGAALDILVQLSIRHPYLQFLEGPDGLRSIYGGLVFTTGMIVICPVTVLNANGFSISWLLARGGSRFRLGRRLVGRTVLVGALPLLAFYMATEMAWSRLSGEAWRIDLLLEAQVLAFAALGFAYSFRRKYPNRSRILDPTLVAMVVWAGGLPLADLVDFGTPMLMLLVIGSAATAIFAVGYGLARADYLS